MKLATLTAIAAIATATGEPIADQDKLTTRPVGMGKAKVIEITGKADTEPLTVSWGPKPEHRMTIPAGSSKTRKVSLNGNYKVTATEDGEVVDEETNTRKTGMKSAKRLR